MTAHNPTTNRAGQNTRRVTGLSACGLCLGDMIELVTLEGIDVICIQCGHRAPSPKEPDRRPSLAHLEPLPTTHQPLTTTH
jgi:hypothetical protein